MTRQLQPSLLHHFLRVTATHAADLLFDEQLLARFVADRDEAAFAALVERHGPLGLGVCRRVLRHQADVEDAFQATFLVLARKATSIRTHVALGGWLYRVAHRLACKARTRTARRQSREVPLEDIPAPTSDLASRELCAALDEELDRLPEKYRLPIVLCCLETRVGIR